MRITIEVDDGVVAVGRRVLTKRNVVVMLGLLVFGTSAVYAEAIDVPNQFEPTTLISSFDVNENFATIADAASVYTNPNTNQRYSLNAGFCAVTASTYDANNVGGYAGAKTKCETACGGSDTAHMCTANEMVRFSATGGPVPSAVLWVASGVYSNGGDPTARVRDCGGWTSNAADQGLVWSSGAPDSRGCSTQVALACCD